MRLVAYIGLLLGAVLFTGLLVHAGVGDVVAAAASVGWGILPICVVRLPVLLADTLSWHALLRPPHRRAFMTVFGIRYIADCINTLLPVARIGGELVRAQLLAREGVAGAICGASVVVDLTAGVATQVLFTAVGIAAFVMIIDGIDRTALLLGGGLGLFALGLAGFFVAQRCGLFVRLAKGVERIAGVGGWREISGGAGALDLAITRLYGLRGDVAACCFWRIVGWLAGTIEIWLIMDLLGYPVSIGEAFVLESLGQAARSAGFMIPAGLGAQEGGLLLVGAQLGLTAELALSLSLLKRVRELLIGVPGLLLWQAGEGRLLWARRKR